MQYRYKTFGKSGSGMFKAKGSKHIGYARHVEDESKAADFLDHLRRDHHAARHICYAWRLGTEGENYRANDDGEPSNSAGQPILGQLVKYEITYGIVAVVRYFGGTKLGVGGLIEAYRTAASLAIEDAEITEMRLMAQFRLHFGYGRMSDVMTAIRTQGWEESEQDFTSDCRLKISVLPEMAESVHHVFKPFGDIRIETLGIH